MNINEKLSEMRGEVEMIIDYKDGRKETKTHKNTILDAGRNALAASLTNNYGGSYNYFISKMVFGSGGTDNGVPKYVASSRTALFGLYVASKPVIATTDGQVPSQAVFTSVVAFDEGNGYTLNEMGLVMNNDAMYSMVTFGGLTKDSSMQVTFNWRIFFS